MEKRMNKEELIEIIDNLGIDLEECWILSTAALTLRGLYHDAKDLDIAVTEKGLEQLKSKYNLKQKPNGWYIVNDKVECCLDTKEAYKIERYDKYNLESLEKYFDFLKESKREKDKVKYEIVKDLLGHSEYLDLYDKDENLTGERVLRFKNMKPTKGSYIYIVIVFIENSEGKFLIQKTSKQKGSVFATTGGLVSSGYNADEAIVKEIKEELGLDIDISELKIVETIRHEYAFQRTYYLKKDIDIKDIILQEDEVENVYWLSIDEINTLIEKGEFRKGNIESFKHIIENK